MTSMLEEIRLESMRELGFGIEAMQKVKVCSKCGNPSPCEEQFCRECGHRLPDKTLYDIYKERHTVCTRCGTVVASDAEYCPQCGNKLNQKNYSKQVS